MSGRLPVSVRCSASELRISCSASWLAAASARWALTSRKTMTLPVPCATGTAEEVNAACSTEPSLRRKPPSVCRPAWQSRPISSPSSYPSMRRPAGLA